MMNVSQTISGAISNHQLLDFSYRGFRRIVEPYCFGTDKKGHLALRAFQVGGASESNEPIGWKIFHIDEISNLQFIPNQIFSLRPEYKRGDSAFVAIRAQA